MDLNRLMIIGNLGNTPTLNHTTVAGRPVTNFSVATNERWADSNGEQREHTEWHQITAFGKLAETCAQYLKKGRRVYLEGRVRTEEWTKDGQLRRTKVMIADKMIRIYFIHKD